MTIPDTDGEAHLQAYQMCDPNVDTHIKTIANTYYLAGVAVHPHNFHFRCDPLLRLAVLWCLPAATRGATAHTACPRRAGTA